jgi:putative DNA primase/helicase
VGYQIPADVRPIDNSTWGGTVLESGTVREKRDILRKTFNQLSEKTIGGNISIDDDLIELILSDRPDLEIVLCTDPDRASSPEKIYRKAIRGLGIFENEDIEKILSKYLNSRYWESLNGDKESLIIQAFNELEEEMHGKEKEETGKTDDKNNSSNEEKSENKQKEKHDRKQSNSGGTGQSSGEKQSIRVYFDEIAEKIMSKIPLFAMEDTGEIFTYQHGVYSAKGYKTRLGRAVRELYHDTYLEKFYDVYPFMQAKAIVPDFSPAGSKFIGEVLEYIRDYESVKREVIDRAQNRYLNFENCLFDLRDWKKLEHSPKIRTIVQLPVEYDPNAKCPKILEYFKSCELPEESIVVLEEFAGYCLTPDVRMQKAVMLYGKGSNGKSVFINLLKILLGRDFVSSESLHKLETNPFRVANLYGKRLNAFPDLKDTPLQTNEVFNIVVGGDKQLTGERKHENSFDFDPTIKMLFSANKIPFAHSDNFAYYRRWILIEFPKTFEKDEIDESLLDKLTTEEEMSGFVNIMLDRLKAMLERGRFSYDVGVAEIEKQYLLHSDNVAVFEETCCRDCAGVELPTDKGIVYGFYLAWCKSNNLIPSKVKVFTRRLDKLGRRVQETTYNEKDGRKVHRYYYTNMVVDFKENRT